MAEPKTARPKKSASKDVRTFESPLETTLPFQLVPHKPVRGQTEEEGDEGEHGRRIEGESSEAGVLSRLIDRISKL